LARILITSGPTRQYLDPVRYLTNASSGRMGQALAQAVIDAGHEALVVSGPVQVEYPPAAQVISVLTTQQMLDECQQLFAKCDGLIGVAAPCDYRPQQVASNKIAKNGEPLKLELIETPDIVATLAAEKGDRWAVGFALETEDQHFRAVTKLERKRCDLMVINGPEAMHAPDNTVELIDPAGDIVAKFIGSKQDVGRKIFAVIEERLINTRP
jgi:phosphopantothenoylcysteine decarboxylase/phosphopantothenate--cysteine ligase